MLLVANLHYLDQARDAVQASPQFRRYGPATALLVGIPPEPPLLTAFELTTLAGPPHQLDFNILP